MQLFDIHIAANPQIFIEIADFRYYYDHVGLTRPSAVIDIYPRQCITPSQSFTCGLKLFTALTYWLASQGSVVQDQMPS